MTEADFRRLVRYLSLPSNNYWNPINNCATVACGAWNYLFPEQLVDATNSDFLDGLVCTPKGLHYNLRTIDGHFENYSLARALGE